ncbi:hypothetical protein MKW92_051541 [Papaver armeniacum]|nr:hypothetical protein MKW92_051541 [Papaver armeniacum]
MAMECITEFPHNHMDRCPRKRPRLLGWDVLPSATSEAQIGIICAQEVGNVTSFVPSNHTTSSSLFGKGVVQNGSPHGEMMIKMGITYKIHSKMGEGTFGQVLECWDKDRNEMVAVKIIRSIKKYREAAMIEVDVLEKLARHDKNGINCVQIRSWFDYRNHICILIRFSPENNYRSFPIDLVRELGRQLLESIAFMHDLHLVHTDLKPENILLVSNRVCKGAGFEGKLFLLDHPKTDPVTRGCQNQVLSRLLILAVQLMICRDHSYIVSTRHYRAPEVILGLGWSYPCDIWSIGCILIELCSGETMFKTHENLEHLAMMERVLGSIPSHMLKRVGYHAEKYIRKGRLNWPEGATSRESIKAVSSCHATGMCAENLVMDHVDHSAGDLIGLLQGLLTFDPLDRMTAREALRHPLFTRERQRISQPFNNQVDHCTNFPCT